MVYHQMLHKRPNLENAGNDALAALTAAPAHTDHRDGRQRVIPVDSISIVAPVRDKRPAGTLIKLIINILKKMIF